jgi:spermidine/putrescine-binding protein
MLSLPGQLLTGQTLASDSNRVSDIFILRTGYSFTNQTDSTYYAIPRYRLQKLLLQAELADSIRVLWRKDRDSLGLLIEKNGSNAILWRNAATVAGGFAVLEAVLLIFKR